MKQLPEPDPETPSEHAARPERTPANRPAPKQNRPKHASKTWEEAPKKIVPPTAPAAAESKEGGFLEVKSQPWAYLYVDGKQIGETPGSVRLPGKHRARVERPGHVPLEKVFMITAGRRAYWEPKIRPE